MPQLLRSQKPLETQYDCAISYLQNGDRRRFYGGVNEFVLEKVHAARKIAFLHCDYLQCGADCEENNALYRAFDRIAACSDGCRRAFLQAMPDRALRALACVRGQGIAAMLHLVGSGPKEQELRALAQSLGLDDAVIFHGSQSNPYRFMRNADLLLMTSFHEAAPMVIDEACCLGLPVLSTATTSTQEMILRRGCGWVCGQSQDSINSALEEILRGRSARERVRSQIQGMDIDNKQAMSQLEKLIGT